MAGTVAGTIAVGYLRRLRPRAAPASAPGAAPGQARRPWWKPTWSVPAALRALRATIVVPALFALSLEGIGKPQMALFASFGGFATLVFASFGGTRKDKLLAHLGLAVVGSVGLTIGTLVSGTAWIAAVVTVPVAFAIFFAGVIGPNAASGVTAALLGYVLPVASVGGVATIPDRLAGWWLASAVGTAAVLLTSPPSEGGRLRAAAGRMAAELANSTASCWPPRPARWATLRRCWPAAPRLPTSPDWSWPATRPPRTCASCPRTTRARRTATPARASPRHSRCTRRSWPWRPATRSRTR
jgi:hypothetical protein